jgi:hypothetical protein
MHASADLDRWHDILISLVAPRYVHAQPPDALEVLLADTPTWMASDLDVGSVFQNPGTGAYVSATDPQQAACHGLSL